MIRLFKLAIFAVLGYVLYEFFQGLSAQPGSSGGSGGMRRDLKKALNEGAGRTRMTGQGEGAEVSVEDQSGASRKTRVGRGAAVSR
jgi:hypothetical protein